MPTTEPVGKLDASCVALPGQPCPCIAPPSVSLVAEYITELLLAGALVPSVLASTAPSKMLPLTATDESDWPLATCDVESESASPESRVPESATVTLPGLRSASRPANRAQLEARKTSVNGLNKPGPKGQEVRSWVESLGGLITLSKIACLHPISTPICTLGSQPLTMSIRAPVASSARWLQPSVCARSSLVQR